MAATAADRMVECLLEWGVDTIFGLPGDGINGIMEALRQRQDTIRFVQVRHEETAALMACGYAKWTGRLGVCLATSGPGGIHLLTASTTPSSTAARARHHRPAISRPRCTLTRSRTSSSTSCSWMSAYTMPASWAAHVEHVDLACRTAVAAGGWRMSPCRSICSPCRSSRRPFRPQCSGTTSDGGRARHRPPRPRRNSGSGRDSRRPAGRFAYWPAAVRCTPAIELASRGAARGARRKSAAGQSGDSDDTPMHGRGRPARDAASAGGAGVLRHATDRRQHVSLYRILSEARAGAAACRSTWTARGSVFAIPSNAAWWAMPAHAPRIARAAPAERGPDLPRSGAKEHARMAPELEGAAGAARQADEAASRRLMSSTSCWRTTPLSPPTPGPTPHGPRATSICART